MHEMNLAVSLVRRVEAEASKAQLVKVTDVEVQVGNLQSIESDLFSEAFKVASVGSRIEGADLHITRVKAEACCLVCGETYEPEYADFQCPACGLAEPQILQGRDMILSAVSGEQ
jgi:hydrogenase nickel incorporation protein HypA/HybF